MSLEPWSQTYVRVYPMHIELGEADWIFKPKSVKGIKPLEHLHIMECSFSEKARWVPINNLTGKTVELRKDTHLGSARKLTEYEVPMPDTFDFEINEVEETSAEKGEEELSPKQKAEQEFHEAFEKLPADVQEFIREFKTIFIPDTEYGHSFMKIDPIDLPVKSENIKPSPPLAKRKYTAKEQELINTFIETGLKSGLIEQTQSPCSSALHVVFQGAKSRIAADLGYALRGQHGCAVIEVPKTH